MSVSAPLDIESPHEGSKAVDEIVIHDDITVQASPVRGDEIIVVSERSTTSAFRDDPAMTFVYLGIVTLVAIIAAAAMLAL